MPKTLNDVEVVTDTKLRTYEEYRTWMLNLAQQNSPEWTDFYPADPGVMLVELMAGVADMLSYNQDRIYGESKFGTAQMKQSLLDHCRLTGYNPGKASCATCYVDVTVSGATTLPGINSTSASPLKVANKPQVQRNVKTFELVEETTIAGAGTYNLLFVEGSTVRNEIVGSASGGAGEFFFVSGEPLAYSSDGSPYLTVEVNNGALWEVWTHVDTFIDSGSSDKHYVVRITASNKAVIQFGDGTNGMVPSAGTNNVRVTYRVGGGEEANFIRPETINSISYDSTGVVTAVSGTTQPSGGANPENVFQIKQNAPAYFSTQNRVVTHEDYAAAALNVNGVDKASAKWYKGNPLQEVVYIAVSGPNPIPTGSWDPVTETGVGTLGAVGRAIASKKCASVKLFVEPVVPVEIVVKLDIKVYRKFYTNAVIQNVRQTVIDHIRGTYENDIPDILPLSNLIAVIEDVEGVDYVDVVHFYRNPYIAPRNVTTADTVISPVGVGANLVEEEWIVEFTSETEFEVRGSVSGLQQTTGTIGSVYVSDNGAIAFLLQEGPNSLLNTAGDTYVIRTSSVAGNIPIFEGEIPVVYSTSVTVTGKGGIE